MLNVSPEHPAVLLSLRQVQCQRLLVASEGNFLPDTVLEQLNNTVMVNPTNLRAWHVSGPSVISESTLLALFLLSKQALLS